MPFLKEQLKPVVGVKADTAKIAKLIADLDSPRYAVREAGMRDLERLGNLALSAVQEMLKKPGLNAEVRERLEKLTDKINKPDTGAEWMRPLRGGGTPRADRRPSCHRPAERPCGRRRLAADPSGKGSAGTARREVNTTNPRKRRGRSLRGPHGDVSGHCFAISDLAIISNVDSWPRLFAARVCGSIPFHCTPFLVKGCP